MSSISENVYVAFVIDNLKHNVSYIYFLQYNGNEEELAKLNSYIRAYKDAGYEAEGEMSSFQMEIKTLYSEETVNQIQRLNFAMHTSFRKCLGKFVCPITKKLVENCSSENEEVLYLDDLEDELFECFSRHSIVEYFKN
jgi:hypothetical protein